MYIYFYPKENATSSSSLTFTRLANFVEIRSKWVVMSEKHMLWTCYANISYDLFFFEVKNVGGGGGVVSGH